MAASSTRRISARNQPLAEEAGSAVPAWAEALGSKLVDDMASRWRDGHGPSAEELLAEHEQLCDHPEVAVRLIYEEICQREQAGDEVDTLEVISRFPQWQGELEVLMGCHRLMHSSPKRPKFPKAGERLGDFSLVSELDRGAAGRVFLATQPRLSDRPVVLKLTPCTGGEHLSLARLQHTHIVPLYLAQDFPERNLRALCMPYVGGLSLARVLKALNQKAPADRTGADLAEVLEHCLGNSSTSLPQHGPALDFLARASYEQALCWIGACLADALDYAHQRGLVHLDVKPSNVLVAGDAQPMLLDFHLAREPIRPESADAVWMGGTAGYMSPEQQAVLTALGDGQTVTTIVDGRADIYSLGMLLYESFGGEVPDSAQVALPRIEQFNRQISRGVADIIHTCLATDPSDRYADAAGLAQDLRRHLAHLPLRQVANRSLAERWQKWRRRKPQAIAFGAMLLVVVATVGVMVRAHVMQRFSEAATALRHGRNQHENRAYDTAKESFLRGYAALAGLPLASSQQEELLAAIRQTRHARAAEHLERLVDQLRFLEVSQELPATAASELAAGCRAVWQRRHLLISNNGTPPSTEHPRISADLVDLVLLWNRLEQRLDLANKGLQRDGAVALAEAEAILGPHLALQLAQGPDAVLSLDKSDEPRSSWEHVAIGRALLSIDQLPRSAWHFKQAVEARPQEFWPNFYQAVCAFRSRQFADAIQGFSVCVALAPQRCECYYNRALAQAALGNIDRAIDDDTRALELNAAFASARLHRATLYSRQQQYLSAEADLQQAATSGADPAQMHYSWAVLHLSRGNRSAAEASVQRALVSQPDHAEAQALRAQLGKQP